MDRMIPRTLRGVATDIVLQITTVCMDYLAWCPAVRAALLLMDTTPAHYSTPTWAATTLLGLT